MHCSGCRSFSWSALSTNLCSFNEACIVVPALVNCHLAISTLQSIPVSWLTLACKCCLSPSPSRHASQLHIQPRPTWLHPKLYVDLKLQSIRAHPKVLRDLYCTRNWLLGDTWRTYLCIGRGLIPLISTIHVVKVLITACSLLLIASGRSNTTSCSCLWPDFLNSCRYFVPCSRGHFSSNFWEPEGTSIQRVLTWRHPSPTTVLGDQDWEGLPVSLNLGPS